MSSDIQKFLITFFACAAAINVDGCFKATMKDILPSSTEMDRQRKMQQTVEKINQKLEDNKTVYMLDGKALEKSESRNDTVYLKNVIQ